MQPFMNSKEKHKLLTANQNQNQLFNILRKWYNTTRIFFPTYV